MSFPTVLFSLLWARAAEVPVFEPELQFRPRFEADTGRDGAAGIGDVAYVTHRARLGASVRWDRFAARLVFQDVRAWGEETDTRRDYSGDGVDLAIGTVTWKPTAALAVTLGRDEISLLDERLVAKAVWRQPGRHFDGGRMTYADGTWGAEVAGMIVVDGDDFDFAARDQVRDGVGDQTLWWARAGMAREDLTAQGLVVVDDRRNAPGAEILRFTPGVFLKGRQGVFSGRFESYGQVGTLAGGTLPVRAFMMGLQGTLSPAVTAQPTFTLGYDMLSGDADPDDGVFGRFDALSGANHRYYGHFDIAYFIRGGVADDRGLHDPHAVLTATPVDRFSVRVDQHLFAPYSRGDGLLAAETDLQLTVAMHDAITTRAGGSVWVPLEDPTEATDWFAWLMVDVSWSGPIP